MARILITNDDGIDSPMLLPLAAALHRLGHVRTVVPDRERSWIGKAISRFDRVAVRDTLAQEGALKAVTGTPADCVNLGLYELFPDPSTLVVSGINLGLNFGSGFFLSSGTIGAALEAYIAGVPAIAFSMALPQDAYGLSGKDRTSRLGDLPVRAAAVAADITDTILRQGFPPGVDLFSVNFPASVSPQTPRRVTPIARTTYASLFDPDGDGYFRHRIRHYDVAGPSADARSRETDITVIRRGEVSIAPVRLDLEAQLGAPLVQALELQQGDDRQS